MKAILFFFLVTASIQLNAQIEALFNGKDLSNFEIVLEENTDIDKVDIDTLFYVEDGVINAKGKPFGYIRTKDTYENYTLHVEWRWVEEPSNSGVLLHVTDEDKVWPLTVEAQLHHTDAGDIVLIGEGSKATVSDSTYQINPGDDPWTVIKKMEDTSEKPAGEWNTYEITCKNASVELKVNGVLQNYATDIYPNSGHIAFQSEGSWIQFRNITIQPLK